MGTCWVKPVAEEDAPNSTGTGSKLNVYTLDPREVQHGQRTIFIPDHLMPGPCSDTIVLQGMPDEYSPTDARNNFLFDPVSKPDAFDAAHTLGTTTRVVNMYKRAMERVNYNMPFRWQWGNAPLVVRPYAGEKHSVHYSREKVEISFSYCKHPTRKEILFMCRNPDIVAHLTGHLVLDAIKPSFYGEGVPEETRALHEAFADITAIFAHINFLDTCEAIMNACNGDLSHPSNFLPEIDEGLRNVFGREYGLRNVTPNLKIIDVVAEYHDWSRVFTSAIYGILVRMCGYEYNPTRGDKGGSLHRTGIHLAGVVLRGFIDAPMFEVTFRDVARAIIKAEPSRTYKKIIREEFRNRRIFDKDEKPKRWNGVTNLGGCLTMPARTGYF